MSYEGYKQYICKNGHYWTADIYDYDNQNECPICGEPPEWTNSVDDTNGSHDDAGKRIDGYIKPRLRSIKKGKCNTCGKDHTCEELYRIPRRKKEKI